MDTNQNPWPEAEDLPEPRYIEVSKNPEGAALEIFRGALVRSAIAISDIAVGNVVPNAQSALRLKAANLVVERVLGKVKEGSHEGWDEALDKLTKDIKK